MVGLYTERERIILVISSPPKGVLHVKFIYRLERKMKLCTFKQQRSMRWIYHIKVHIHIPTKILLERGMAIYTYLFPSVSSKLKCVSRCPIRKLSNHRRQLIAHDDPGVCLFTEHEFALDVFQLKFPSRFTNLKKKKKEYSRLLYL